MPFRVGAVPAVRGEGKARIVAPAAAGPSQGGSASKQEQKPTIAERDVMACHIPGTEAAGEGGCIAGEGIHSTRGCTVCLQGLSRRAHLLVARGPPAGSASRLRVRAPAGLARSLCRGRTLRETEQSACDCLVTSKATIRYTVRVSDCPTSPCRRVLRFCPRKSRDPYPYLLALAGRRVE